MAVSDITTTVAPLAPVNTNVPVPHTLAGPSMTATKENLFPPSLSGFQAQNFSVNPTMMRSQEQTMMNTFNNCEVICQKRGRVLYHGFQIPRNR